MKAQRSLSMIVAWLAVTVLLVGAAPLPRAWATPITAGTPTLTTSSPRVDQTLTVNPGTWSPTGVSLTVTWQRKSSTGAIASISGATARTYQPGPADVGYSLRARIQGSLDGESPLSASTNWTNPVIRATLTPTPTPTLSDTTPVVDQTFSGATGTWGPAPVALTYTWYRVSTSGTSSAITGATAVTYQVQSSDVGYRLKLTVRGAKPGYNTVSKTSALSAAVGRATFTTKPFPTITVSGTPRVGKSLTVVPGTYDPAASLTYQWYRDTTAISGATKATYALGTADVGARIKVRVKASRSGYVTVTQWTAATATVQKGLTSLAPVITDTSPAVGQGLGITGESGVGAWSPQPVAGAYQWYRVDATGATKAISGATSATYVVTAGDLGMALKVRVSGSKSDYATVSRSSSRTSAVIKGTYSAKGTPTITRNGATLTAQEGTWTPAPSSYQYQWYKGATLVSGATARTFSPSASGSFTVKVTAVTPGYQDATMSSATFAYTSDRLNPSQSLLSGQRIASPNGQYVLIMQGDGNLVLYRSGGVATWASNTQGPGNWVAMQSDGNLVVYTSTNKLLWGSTTDGFAGAYLKVQDDGNLVIYRSGQPLWVRGETLYNQLKPGEHLTADQSRLSRNHAYVLIMQGDGNLVLYRQGGGAIWASNTRGSGNWVVMQGDGNLVVYTSGGRALWASNTGDRSGASLRVQDDAKLVIYLGSTAVWSSGGTNIDRFVADNRGKTLANAAGTYPGECVSLVSQYLLQVYGIRTGAWGNAVDYRAGGSGGNQMAANGFTWHTDRNFQNGDVIVWGDDPGSMTGPYGHIGVWYNGKVFDQNYAGRRTADLDPFFSGGYLGYWRR